MKASIKLRDDEDKPPLLRAKLPISLFTLPFAASVVAGDPADLSVHLLTSFPSFPSLKLSYHPCPSNPSSPFSLTFKSGAGRLGSPANSPFHISLHLSPSPNPSFSITLKPNLGHFSLSKTVASPSLPNPNPDRPKENGGGVHLPIPVASMDRDALDELVSSGVGVRVRTGVSLGRRAGLKVRWAVKLPPAEAGSYGVFGRLPYLSLDKISVERVERAEEEAGREAKEWSEKDLEAMRGMCFWMGREVEELRKENGSIKESIKAVRHKFLEANENRRRVNADVVGSKGSSWGPVDAGRRV